MGPYDLSAIKRNRPKITTTKSELSTLRAELAAAKECREVMPGDLPHLTYSELIDMAERLRGEVK